MDYPTFQSICAMCSFISSFWKMDKEKVFQGVVSAMKTTRTVIRELIFTVPLAQVGAGDMLDVPDVIIPLPCFSSPLFLMRIRIEAIA